MKLLTPIFRIFDLNTLIIAVLYVILKPFFYNIFYFHFSPNLSQHRTNILRFLDNHYIPFDGFSIFGNALTNPMLLVPFLFFAGFAFLNRQTKWESFDNPRMVKRLVMLLVGYITWWNVTLPFNHYFEQWYLLDRIILIFLMISLWFSPIVVLLVVPLNFLFFAQMTYPVGAMSTLHFFVLYDGIILFLCLIFAKKIVSLFPQIATKNGVNPSWTLQYLVLAYCLLTSSYLYSGIKKIVESPKGINWVFENEQYIDFQFFMEQGWLYFLSPSTKNQLLETAHALNSFILAAILLAQIGVIFSFANKKYFRMVVGTLICFHVGFFLLDGCSFLEWIILDAFFIYVFTISKEFSSTAFNKNTFLSSMGLFLLGFIIFTPPKLAWYESRSRRIFSFEVENTEGVRFKISPNDLGFGNAVFAGLNINYLFNRKTLSNTDFGDKYKGMNLIKHASMGNLDSLTLAFGENPYNLIIMENTKRYIVNYFKNSEKQYRWLSVLSPPGHYLSMRWQDNNIHPTLIQNPKSFIVKAQEKFINSNDDSVLRDSFSISIPLK